MRFANGSALLTHYFIRLAFSIPMLSVEAVSSDAPV
jgi:hypothetical protein